MRYEICHQNEICHHDRKLNNDFSNTKFNKTIKTESIKPQPNDHFFFHNICHVSFHCRFHGKIEPLLIKTCVQR